MKNLVHHKIKIKQKKIKKKKKNKKKKDKEELSDDNNNDSSSDDEKQSSVDLTLVAMNGRRVTRSSNAKTAKAREKQLKNRREREKTQCMLREKSKKSLKKILNDTGGDFGIQQNEVKFIDPKCYNNINDLPSHSSSNRISIDKARNCIICPIMDHRVPFHISCIKNSSLSANGEWTHLRLNFTTPVAPTKTNREPKQPDVAMMHPFLMFIKELNFRSNDGTNLQIIHNDIKSVQKKLKLLSKQNIEAPIIDQEKLRRNQGNRILILKDLTIRPTFGGRKRGTGKLECHLNGFRYSDHKRNEVRIIFNNIKHAFYQPSKETPSVILHFELKSPILIGKKSTTYIQLYRDVMERYEEIGGRSNYDYDGIRQEQEEKRKIIKINKLFKDFVKKTEEIAKNQGFDLEFDIPEMDLKFYGVPHKQLIRMYPTSNCIIALEDTPNPFVLNIKDVQISHFERVQFSLRNFDLVFVFKDFKKDVIRISSIPREYLDTLQDFLNWQKVLFNTGKGNLDWKELLKSIRNNFSGFVEKGGWDFLINKEDLPPTKSKTNKNRKHNNNNNNNNVSSDEEIFQQSGSEYAPTDDEEDDEYLSDEDDDEDENEFDEDEYSGSDDDDYDNDDNEEEGLSWEELDRKAEAEDRKQKLRERNNEFQNSRQQTNPKRRRIH